MSKLESINITRISVPNLKRHFAVVTLVLLLAIFLLQSFQDHQRKEEILDAQRIHEYHRQLVISGQLMNRILQLRTIDNKIEFDQLAQEALISNNQLKVIQDNLLRLTDEIIALGEQDNLEENESLVSNYVAQLLVDTNALLKLLKKGSADSDFSSQYQNLLPVYELYKDEANGLIEKLSAYSEQEAAQHRTVLWWIVIVIILLVITVSFGFYHIVSSLVKRQFELIEINNQQLEQDNLLRQQNEQAMAEQAQKLFSEQMKMRSILDSTVDAIITITEQGNIDSFNKAAETVFGYPADYVIGKNVKILMPEPYSTEHDSYLKHFRETGEKKIIGIGLVITGLRVDGSTFPIELSLSEVENTKPKLFTGIVRDITKWKKADETLHKTMADLKETQALLEEEEKIARHVFENITAGNTENIPELTSWCQPMGTFSGDMMLSAILPSGALRILLCDFTGHGLPAALGAVPVSSIHSAMAQKGLPLEILMDELNNKLNEMLPTGIFSCIAAVDIDATRTHAHIWNAGLPEVLLVSQKGEIKQRFLSQHLPLGVKRYDRDEMHCQDIRLECGDSLYMLSDGLTEAENKNGDMFGQLRFEKLLMVEANENGRLNTIKNKIFDFVDGAPATDDISLVEIKILVTPDEIALKS